MSKRKVEETANDEIQKRLERLESMSKCLIEASPLAMLRFKGVSVVPDASSVRLGSAATWSPIKISKGSEKGTYAVGSKHCAFYYDTISPRGWRFVSLPQAVVKAGVTRIGLVGPFASVEYHHDCVLVQTSNAVDCNGVDKLTSWRHLFTGNEAKFVVGQGTSAPVLGKNLVKVDQHYLFVEDQGEAGNSGTIMFASNEQGTGLELAGTYFGTAAPISGVRSRGIVSPLPSDPSSFHWATEFKTDNNVEVEVIDGSYRKTISATCQGGNQYSLVDGGEAYWGVLVRLGGADEAYNGSSIVGSSRAK